MVYVSEVDLTFKLVIIQMQSHAIQILEAMETKIKTKIMMNTMKIIMNNIGTK